MKKQMAFGLLMSCGLVIAMGIATAFAQDEVTPEHGKINMADASPVDTGHYEVETSYGYTATTRSWSHGGSTLSRGFASEHAAGLSLAAGVVENVDVSLAMSHGWLRDKDNDHDEDGVMGPITGESLGDLEISGRYRFIQNEKWALDIAYIGGLTIPTGSRSDNDELGNSQDYWSFNQTLVASKDWGRWTANADVGFALPLGDRKGGARGTLNADLSGGYQILPWLQPEVELNYSREFIKEAYDAESLAVTAGLVMPINETWRINTGVQQTVWGRNTDQSTTVSVAAKIAF